MSSVIAMLVFLLPQLQIRIFYDRIAPDKLRRIIMAALIMMYVIYLL